MQTQLQKFDDIEVSTTTLIVATNLVFDLPKLFEALPITHYTVVEKKRGRRKKTNETNPNPHIVNGNIVMVKFCNKLRGVKRKRNRKKSQEPKKKKYFLNCVSVDMFIGEQGKGKFINCKIPANGKFQFTGCKSDEQAKECVRHIWGYIEGDEEIYQMKDDEKVPTLKIIPSMRNITISLGFNIDRKKLNQFINNETDYISMHESEENTQVNIRIPNDNPIEDMLIETCQYDEKTEGWTESRYVKYGEFLNTLTEKERNKKLNQRRFHSFLVFHSGNMILSTLCKQYAKDVYEEFIDLLLTNRHRIEERLDVSIESREEW